MDEYDNVALEFIYLGKAYDTVPRDVAMATLSWMGVPMAEVRMVEGTYEETKGSVRTGNIGGIQGERRTETGECPKPTVMHCRSGSDQQESEYNGHSPYADDLAVVADNEANFQERIVDWKEIFGKYGLRVSLEKMEVLLIGQQNIYIDIRLDGKKLKKRDTFVYLGGAVYGDDSTDTEFRRIVPAGASAWKKVKGLMGDRHIFRKLKGKFLNSCITSAQLYDLETMTMTEKQQKRQQVCENN